MIDNEQLLRYPRLPYAAIALSVLAVSALYLWPNALEFPMDDTYIHFVYAQNLAETGQLMFNGPGEAGVGTTSIAWVLLLAGGDRLGIPMHLLAKTLGIVSLIALGAGLYRLFAPRWGARTALLAALATTLSGHLLWFSLSGMETTLFLALGIQGLLFYRDKRWNWLGVSLGLLALTRPEGLALAAVIGGVEIARERRVPRGLAAAGLFTALLCVPWFGYLIIRTGHLLPTSAIGKQLSSVISLRFALQQTGTFARLAAVPGLVYIGLWLIYILVFVLGGMALPGPDLPVVASLGQIEYTISMWAVLGWLGALVPLTWAGYRRVKDFKTWKGRFLDSDTRPLVILVLWAAVHNLTYILLLPSLGTASRYGAINHVLLWSGLVVLTLHATRPGWRRNGIAAWLLIVAVTNTGYWNRIYDANLAHMLRVRIPAAHYLRDAMAPEDRCAVSDIGAMRYFGEIPIIDLGGLVDPDLGDIYLKGDLPAYILQLGATCVILPGRTGTLEDGWLNPAAIMGFTTTPLFSLHEIKVFSIDRDLWLTGYLPTMNYQATVSIYRIDLPPR